MKLLLVINPAAGGNNHEDTIEFIQQVARKENYEPHLLLTRGEDNADRLKRALAQHEPDIVIAGGGDGTIRMVAEEIASTNVKLAILPLGSANGLATALGLPKDPREGIVHTLTKSRLRYLDMLEFNGQHKCLHLADVGVNALIVKKYEEDQARGMLGYAKNLLSAIQESPLLTATIRTPEGEVTKEGYMMAFANAHMYGTGVHISEGSVSDGKFEICNVERIALDDAIKAGLTILNVFIDREMFSDVISCTEAVVNFNRPAPFQIDGEYMGMVEELKIKIMPRAIKLLH